MPVDISNLGELEMSVLEYVWEHGETDVKNAHEDVGVDRGITHNTVQSTFKRLWEKGLLERSKDGRAYVYSSKFDRKELTELMVGELVEQVAGADVNVALEAFVNLADRAGDSTLEALEQLVASRRGTRGESDE
jgi:predicted transcriptional regulator